MKRVVARAVRLRAASSGRRRPRTTTPTTRRSLRSSGTTSASPCARWPSTPRAISTKRAVTLRASTASGTRTRSRRIGTTENQSAKRDAERAAGEEKRKAAVTWLQTASQAELEDEDLVHDKGARYEDVRAEKRRRHETAADEERSADLSRIASLIPEGGTVVDEGAYIPPPMVGLRPIHRHATVYYNVKLIHGYPDDAAHAKVEYGVGRGRKTVSAEHFADMLAKGHTRVVREGEVPPQLVADRIGVEKWKDIRHVKVGNRDVWVGRATFGSEDLVLDEKGKLIRARNVVDAAKSALQNTPSLPPGTTRG